MTQNPEWRTSVWPTRRVDSPPTSKRRSSPRPAARPTPTSATRSRSAATRWSSGPLAGRSSRIARGPPTFSPSRATPGLRWAPRSPVPAARRAAISAARSRSAVTRLSSERMGPITRRDRPTYSPSPPAPGARSQRSPRTAARNMTSSASRWRSTAARSSSGRIVRRPRRMATPSFPPTVRGRPTSSQVPAHRGPRAPSLPAPACRRWSSSASR